MGPSTRAPRSNLLVETAHLVLGAPSTPRVRFLRLPHKLLLLNCSLARVVFHLEAVVEDRRVVGGWAGGAAEILELPEGSVITGGPSSASLHEEAREGPALSLPPFLLPLLVCPSTDAEHRNASELEVFLIEGRDR